MERLFLFIYQYRAFFTFVVLEVVCFWLIVQNNQYQGAKFFNSSNTVVASLNNFSQSIRDYFLLSEVNSTLANENAELRRRVEKQKQELESLHPVELTDTVLTSRFEFVSAKVVNNQVDRFKNFITINKGEDAGIEAGMAVMSPLGVVGKVKAVSKHYSVVTSILHIDYMVSAVLKRTGHFGTVQWAGRDPDFVKLKFIPRHVKPEIGDSVVTSGYNAVFPDEVMIGTISHIELSPEELTYNITVSLSQDFRKLAYVSVVKSRLKTEQDLLEKTVEEME
ncbi:MAG TPA: rod shape-determining protein MreC [Ohtaekwangia sp.]|nr:rod shape-determining protein MreC [Ohtaekwangia sp.]